MTLEESVNELSTQTTDLLETCTTLKDNVENLISSAVTFSENAAIVPLMSMSTNIVEMQTLIVNLITT
jgi:hypothetical protein